MVASLQYTGAICNLGPRSVLSSSSLYSGIARLAPQIGHLSQGCIFNLSELFASLFISSYDHSCYFDVESWDVQYGAENLLCTSSFCL